MAPKRPSNRLGMLQTMVGLAALAIGSVHTHPADACNPDAKQDRKTKKLTEQIQDRAQHVASITPQWAREDVQSDLETMTKWYQNHQRALLDLYVQEGIIIPVELNEPQDPKETTIEWVYGQSSLIPNNVKEAIEPKTDWIYKTFLEDTINNLRETGGDPSLVLTTLNNHFNNIDQVLDEQLNGFMTTIIEDQSRVQGLYDKDIATLQAEYERLVKLQETAVWELKAEQTESVVAGSLTPEGAKAKNTAEQASKMKKALLEVIESLEKEDSSAGLVVEQALVSYSEVTYSAGTKEAVIRASHAIDFLSKVSNYQTAIASQDVKGAHTTGFELLDSQAMLESLACDKEFKDALLLANQVVIKLLRIEELRIANGLTEEATEYAEGPAGELEAYIDQASRAGIKLEKQLKHIDEELLPELETYIETLTEDIRTLETTLAEKDPNSEDYTTLTSQLEKKKSEKESMETLTNSAFGEAITATIERLTPNDPTTIERLKALSSADTFATTRFNELEGELEKLEAEKEELKRKLEIMAEEMMTKTQDASYNNDIDIDALLEEDTARKQGISTRQAEIGIRSKEIQAEMLALDYLQQDVFRPILETLMAEVSQLENVRVQAISQSEYETITENNTTELEFDAITISGNIFTLEGFESTITSPNPYDLPHKGPWTQALMGEMTRAKIDHVSRQTLGWAEKNAGRTHRMPTRLEGQRVFETASLLAHETYGSVEADMLIPRDLFATDLDLDHIILAEIEDDADVRQVTKGLYQNLGLNLGRNPQATVWALGEALLEYRAALSMPQTGRANTHTICSEAPVGGEILTPYIESDLIRSNTVAGVSNSICEAIEDTLTLNTSSLNYDPSAPTTIYYKTGRTNALPSRDDITVNPAEYYDVAARLAGVHAAETPEHVGIAVNMGTWTSIFDGEAAKRKWQERKKDKGEEVIEITTSEEENNPTGNSNGGTNLSTPIEDIDIDLEGQENFEPIATPQDEIVEEELE